MELVIIGIALYWIASALLFGLTILNESLKTSPISDFMDFVKCLLLWIGISSFYLFLLAFIFSPFLVTFVVTRPFLCIGYVLQKLDAALRRRHGKQIRTKRNSPRRWDSAIA
jgi:hypothetical protein